MLSTHTTTLSNGIDMPLLGLGVWRMEDGQEVEQAVRYALETGYRSIDTAKVYANEKGVGRGMKASGVPRGDIFLATKVWNSDQGYDETLKAFDQSLEELKEEYLDLYLVHWPVEGKYIESWRALERLYKEGRVRAIGVSNFLQHHLEDLMAKTTIAPMVNQIEFHPRLQQPGLQSFCRKHAIQIEAWSPLMKGRVLEIEALNRIAEKYGKNAVQVTLRWMVQKGIVAIPKSSKKDRIRSNVEVFDFSLSDSEIAIIDKLDTHERVGPDPDSFDF